ncbi:MAG TPA: PrsW family intramembrane metalloprotease [Ignavibacteriaceae bacterium]|nr:PrsW family intramembrane metalloprotease [Ignavibacteriaceae bacterium]
MIVYLLIIWKFDRYDREPFRLVLKNYLWGAVGAVILSIILSSLFSGLFSKYTRDAGAQVRIDAVVIAPLVEEITKGIFLLLMISDKRFDNITDGIVYGAAIGLGFGMTENFLYFISFGSSAEQWISVVLLRTFFSAVMHCVSTAILGASLGFSKFKTGLQRYSFPAAGLLVAIFIHLTWNYSVSYQNTALLGIFFLIFCFMAFSAAFALSVSGEKKIIYSQLFDEAASGLIPPEHITILNSTRRNRTGWIDEKIRKSYIKAAITLAFRKMQMQNAEGSKKNIYENDIRFYRSFIKDLLYGKGIE